MKKEIRGEADHCKDRLHRFCRGQGLDIGCGMTKITPNAIGIDLLRTPATDMIMDGRKLEQYGENHFDFIFSSHLLEEVDNTEPVIREWLRVIKPGGYLVLYQADEDLYYKLGDPQCNKNHKHHFNWNSLWEIIKKIDGTKLTHHARYNEDPYKEWSFELVVQKTGEGFVEENHDMSEGISFLIPSLNRPQGIQDFIESLDRTTTNPDNIEVIFGIHDDDLANMNKIDELDHQTRLSVKYEFIQRHPEGVHLAFLWNQVYEKARYPILGFFGDDVLFRTPGWDEEIRKEFAVDKNILVSCNDVHIQKKKPRGGVATLFFTHKSVHQKFGFYLYPEFRRWYTDNFWDLVYRRAGKLHYRDDIVTEHMHPDVFKDRIDDTYRNMENLKGTDRVIWASGEVRNLIVKLGNELKAMK